MGHRGWECKPTNTPVSLGRNRRERRIKTQKERYLVTLMQVKGEKNIKNSRSDLATFWVNEFPRTHYLHISIPDSKVNEICITLSCSYWEHCI